MYSIDFEFHVPLCAALGPDGGVGNLHVEEGREDEGEEGHGGPAHQVEDGPEAGHRLGDEEEGGHTG